MLWFHEIPILTKSRHDLDCTLQEISNISKYFCGDGFRVPTLFSMEIPNCHCELKQICLQQASIDMMNVPSCKWSLNILLCRIADIWSGKISISTVNLFFLSFVHFFQKLYLLCTLLFNGYCFRTFCLQMPYYHSRIITLSPVKYLTFEKTRITINWDFSHSSKQIPRQLHYKEKVFEVFQRWLCFPRKVVLYIWTKCGILKPWTNIS